MARLNSTFSSSNLVDLLNKTGPKIVKTTEDAIFNDSTIIRELKAAGGVVQGVTGDDYTWPIEMAKNTSVGARQWASAIPLEMQDINRLASETFAEYSGAVVLDQATMDKNAGPEKIIPYAMSQIGNMRRTFIDLANQAILTGSGTYPSMNGLATLIPETASSGTLHGIDRSGATWWRNQTKASACSTTNAFGPICIKEVQELSALASGGQGKPVFKLGITDDATFANALYYMPDQGTMRNVIVANGGSSDVKFPAGKLTTSEAPIMLHNARLIWDHAATADAIRLFNPEWVKLLVVKNGWFKITPRQEAEDSFSVRILMGLHANMINMNPRRSAVLYNFNS